MGFSGKLEGSRKNESFAKDSDGVLGQAVALTSKESEDASEALSESEKQSNHTQPGFEFSKDDCDLFDGMWVRDDSYPLYAPGSCPLIDESFNCFLNKRPDNRYEKYRWQPKHCNLPRCRAVFTSDLKACFVYTLYCIWFCF